MRHTLIHLRVMTSRMPHGRSLLLLAVYGTLLCLAFVAAYMLRFDMSVPSAHMQTMWSCMPYVVAVELFTLFIAGQFSILLSFFRVPDLYRIALALTCSTCLLVVWWYINKEMALGYPAVSRGVIVGNLIISLFVLCSFRMLLRILRERSQGGMVRDTDFRRVAIIGAGDGGAQLAADMLARNHMRMRPVLFLDDDKGKWKRHIHGIPVVGGTDELAFVRDHFDIESIIIAMPSAPAKKVRDILDSANELGIKVQTVPSMAELATGKVRTTRLRQVQIEDLLGRKQVDLETENIRGMIQGKVVMVTGGGGSIGSELVHQIATYEPAGIIVVDQSEFAMFSLEEHMKELGLASLMYPVVADIRDMIVMRFIMDRYKPQLIFHAAAYKHVPMMERQPATAIVNNSFGTANLAELASEMGIERFVMISTDKAINPTNAMGASKRLAEIFIQSLNFRPGNKTLFMAVRFGNVLNSSGSVIPTFRHQIETGGPVTVTHPEVTRYFMTIPEAVGLVLQCGTLGEGGEIFVLNMGTPIKIVDMARQMIRMSGLVPDVDIDIKFVGLRPGEKLYEELRHNKEQHAPTRHDRIFRFTCAPTPYDKVKAGFADIRERMLKATCANDIREIMKQYVPEYVPYKD